MSVLKVYDGSAWVPVGNLGSVSSYIDCSGGTSDTYGALSGSVNSSNTVFTTSQAVYVTGTLKVFLNGQLQTQGSAEDWTETSPSAGTFTFSVAPTTGDIIIAMYDKVLSTLGNADMVDGIHASATPSANKLLPLDSNAAINLASTYIENTTSDEDLLIKCNDGGVVRTAIQINGAEGSVTMPRQSYVLLSSSDNQTITKNTTTTITFPAATTDVLGEWNASTETFTAKNAGVYSVMFMPGWEYDVASVFAVQASIVSSGGTLVNYINIQTTISPIRYNQIVSGSVKLSAGGTIQFKGWWNSGTTPNVKVSNGALSYATIAKIA